MNAKSSDVSEGYVERVQAALAALRRGEQVVLTDDETRENEGDLVFAAEKATPQAINFMATYGRGLICLTLEEQQVRKLQIPMMVTDNTSPFSTNFTVSIEAARGVTTGISAADRATTVLAAVADDAKPGDLVRPGHIFPLSARPGGVLVRTGQTEGSVDLCRMAGLKPAGVICEVMNPDGTMSRRPDLLRFCKRHKLVLLSVADVVRYRLEKEPLVRRVADAPSPLAGAEGFRAIAYRSDVDSHTHVALVLGSPGPGKEATLVRVHTACFMGDVLGARVCHCGETLRHSLEQIAAAGEGVLVYLDREPKSTSKLSCTHAAEATSEERQRDLGVGSQILRDLGIGKIKLLTNNPSRPLTGIDSFGLTISEFVAIGSGGKAAKPAKSTKSSKARAAKK